MKVVTGSWDKTAKLWDVLTGSLLHDFEHGRSVESVSFSPDGLRIVTGSPGGTAKMWDVQTGALLATFEHGKDAYEEVTDVAFSPDGLTLVTASQGGTAKMWDSGDSKELESFFRNLTLVQAELLKGFDVTFINENDSQ